MTDTYADGFLDGWATAAETLRTRFVTVAWALVTIASLGALSQACRYGEMGELS